MTRFWIFAVMVTSGRLIAIAGAALATGAVAAIVGGWAYSATRYAPDWNVGLLPLVLPAQTVVAAWVVWGALKAGPRPLLRRSMIAAAVSFLLLYGWYFLLLGGGMGLIAVGNLLYLLAGLMLVPAAMAPSDLEGSQRFDVAVRDGTAARRTRMVARALGTATFAAVAAITGYAVALAAPPEARAGVSRGELPPLSCPDHLGEEVASFEGAGDRVSPEFEVKPMWGFEYNSWGYGTLSMRVIDEESDPLYDEEVSLSAGSTGGGEYAPGGTYRLEIDAGEEAKYEVVVCDGEGDRGKYPQAVEPPR